MSPSFNHAVAIVTGAGSGIGFEIASQLAQRGASVVINDIHLERVNQAAQRIRKKNGECIAVAGDASKEEIIDEIINQAVCKYGKIDLCVANAGLTCFGDFFSYSQAQFRKVMNLNLEGTFFLCQAAAKKMRSQGKGGKILLMSSNIGIQTYPQLTAYSMSKAALQMMAKSLVLELSPYKININALAPGATITPRTLEDDPEYASTWQELIPLQKVAKPKDIAASALFLLSPAANHITGHTLVVDGGWTQRAHYPPLSTSPQEINQL